MKLDQPTPLLGGISPNAFMQRYWQREPLLIRQAFDGFVPPVDAAGIRKLARRDEVESRLIWREGEAWQMENGPFARLPTARQAGWTLLVQGVDLHTDAMARLMQAFRFIPDARLDDAMVSIASHGGGVGPHFDSYDVFLLQAAGRRRWRIGRQRDLSLEPDAPLKILRHFEPEEEFVLEPGDMLYLPPDVAHDGVAEGNGCMTISIGFRSPSRAELARGVLETAADTLSDQADERLRKLYRDPGQPAVNAPAAIPDALVEATLKSLRKIRLDKTLARHFLGVYLSEPKPGVVFDDPKGALPDLTEQWPDAGTITLDRRSRMLYCGKRLFINGELAPQPLSRLLRKLANQRSLDCASVVATPAEGELLQEWLEAGWVQYACGAEPTTEPVPGSTQEAVDDIPAVTADTVASETAQPISKPRRARSKLAN